MWSTSQGALATFATKKLITYPQRAVRVGGYFTCGLLLINGFLANIGALPAVIISLAAGAAFTAGSLAVGQRYKLC